MTSSQSATCVVQARMSSVRLPGKVLADLGGITVLSTLVRRLRRAKRLSHIIVATSDTEHDDALARLCEEEGVECHRGALHDVASRFVAVAQRNPEGCLVRISGDSPFSDPGMIDEAVGSYFNDPCDLLTTSSPRTTPHGLSIEVISAAALISSYPSFESGDDREHVTPYFYRHREKFNVRSFTPNAPLSLRVSLAVDTAEDLERARSIARKLSSSVVDAGYSEILEVAERL